MEWVKRIGRRGGDGGGWRDDLPLSEELFFDELTVDRSALELPIHPMFLVRLRVFLEWHMAAGRRLVVIAPADRMQRRCFKRWLQTKRSRVYDSTALRRANRALVYCYP